MTKDEIFEKSLQEIQHNKFEAELSSKNYLKSCYENKEILALANKMGELKIKIAKNNTHELQKERENTKLDLLNLFKKYNKDITKILPNYTCKLCNDSGILENGKICSCLNNKYIENLLNFTNINLTNQPLLNNINLDKYSNKEDIKKLIDILSKIKNTKINTILFSGETGTGKTFIAKSFLKTFVSNNNLGKFYSAYDINNAFLSIHTNFTNEKNLDALVQPDILVIDDLGSESIFNNVTKEYLLILLNERQKENKITLFTTNLTLNDIKNKYNERFLSRLVDKDISLKYNFTGNDLRLK